MAFEIIQLISLSGSQTWPVAFAQQYSLFFFVVPLLSEQTTVGDGYAVMLFSEPPSDSYYCLQAPWKSVALQWLQFFSQTMICCNAIQQQQMWQYYHLQDVIDYLSSGWVTAAPSRIIESTTSRLSDNYHPHYQGSMITTYKFRRTNWQPFRRSEINVTLIR